MRAKVSLQCPGPGAEIRGVRAKPGVTAKPKMVLELAVTKCKRPAALLVTEPTVSTKMPSLCALYAYIVYNS